MKRKAKKNASRKALPMREKVHVLPASTMRRAYVDSVDGMLREAESLQGLAAALLSAIGPTSPDIDELIATAAVAKSHTLSIAIAATRIAAKAERLEMLADLKLIDPGQVQS